MEQNRKFYVTPNHVVDADYIGDALYFPTASPTITPKRKQSELHLTFKNNGESISLYGDAADLAWENFKRATVDSSRGRSFAPRELFQIVTSQKSA